MKNVLTGLAVGLSLLVGVSYSVEAATVTLYNGSGSPSSQGWLIGGGVRTVLGNPAPVALSETPVAGGVQVVTNANSAEYAGYSNYNPFTSSLVNASFPSLDRTLGYSITFSVALNSTTSNSNDRAAFSITVISSDTSAIELGFENGLIFAQNATFTRGENAAFNTTSASTYTLTVLNSGYTLSNGSQTLSGSLRNYIFNPATSSPPLPSNPYTTPNALFFGDNTGQEFGTFTLGAASLTTNDATPVPFGFHPTFGLFILGVWATFHHFKNKKK
ncbi:MAG TPA: hypothetical protein V6D28_18790 [Leptolyngbyaceae cyanobacterium]